MRTEEPRPASGLLRWGLLALAALLAGRAAAQAAPDPDSDWAMAAVHADPLFGGADTCVFWLQLDPEVIPVGDPAAWARFLAGQRAALDAQALALVREFATPELVISVLPFFATEAGHALARADSFAGGSGAIPICSGWYPELAAQRYAAPEKVGPAAVAELHELQRQVADGTCSASPSATSVLVGAIRLSAAHAAAIGAFFRTAAGQQWLEVRRRAHFKAWMHYDALRQGLREHGLCRLPDSEALLLPEPIPADDAELVVEVFVAQRGKAGKLPPGIDSPFEFRAADTLGWRIDGAELRTIDDLVARLRQLPPARLRLRAADADDDGIRRTRKLLQDAGWSDIVAEPDLPVDPRVKLPAFLPQSSPPPPSADATIVVELRVADAGRAEPLPAADDTSGKPGSFRVRVVGHTVRWVVDGRDCRDGPQLVEALRALLTRGTAVDAASGERRLPKVRIDPYPGTFYNDVADTTALAREAGAVVVEFGFGARDPAPGDTGAPAKGR